MSVAPAQRFKRDHRCPICGGADADDRGTGKRCGGFLSSDGSYAHCSRDEHAGTLPIEDGGTFAHRLKGPCKCGATHGEAEPQRQRREPITRYPYCDERGVKLYDVGRFEPKDFRAIPNFGERRILYRLPELLASSKDEIVYIAEGEKDVDNLRTIGAIATCNPMGAGKWKHIEDCARTALLGRRIVIVPDRDKPGRDHARDVAKRLEGVAVEVRILELPPKKDASDWIAVGNGLAELKVATARALDAATYAESLRDEDSSETTEAPTWHIESASPDWITEALPPRQHLLVDTRTGRGSMDKTGAWLFAGAGGAGKSYATIGLGLAVVNGDTWLSTFKTAAPGRALIIAAEDSCEDIRRRVHAIAWSMGMPASAMQRFHVLPIHDRVTSLVAKVGDAYAPSDDTKSLCAELAGRESYDLVVVDPYGRIAGVSVDADNAAAAATISALAMISTAARGLVLGVTHTSMRARLAAHNGAAEGATGVRGATGQTDYARGVIRLEKDKDAVWLSLAKANHVAQWEPVALKRGDHGELTPLGLVELGMIAESNAKETRTARREAAIAERDEADDAAARKAIAENPAGSLRVLRAIVCKERRCGKDRADNAISRCRS